MSEHETVETPETPVVNTDVAVSRTRGFVSRHKGKLFAAAAAAGLFVAGRLSNRVGVTVDTDETPDTESDTTQD